MMTSWKSKSGYKFPRLQNGEVINHCPENVIEERKLRVQLSRLEAQRTRSFSEISGEQHLMKLLFRKLQQPSVSLRDNSDVGLDNRNTVPGFVFSSNGDYKNKTSKKLKNSPQKLILKLASSAIIERGLSEVSIETHRAQSALAVLQLEDDTPHHLVAMETLDVSKSDVQADNQIEVGLMEQMHTLYLNKKQCSQKTEGVKPLQNSKITRRSGPVRMKPTKSDTNKESDDVFNLYQLHEHPNDRFAFQPGSSSFGDSRKHNPRKPKSSIELRKALRRSSKANCAACEARLLERAKELQKYREDAAQTTELTHNKHTSSSGRTKSDPQLTTDLKVQTPRRSLGGHPVVKQGADHGSGEWNKTMHRTAVATHAMHKEFESERQRLKIQEFFGRLEGKPVSKSKTADASKHTAGAATSDDSRRSPEGVCECRYLRMPIKRANAT